MFAPKVRKPELQKYAAEGKHVSDFLAAMRAELEARAPFTFDLNLQDSPTFPEELDVLVIAWNQSRSSQAHATTEGLAGLNTRPIRFEL